MKNGKKLLAVVIALMFLFAAAQAQQLKIEGEKLILPVSETPDGEPVDTEIPEMTVYGKCAGNKLLVKIGENRGYIAQDAAETQLPGVLKNDELPDFGSCETVTAGSPEAQAKVVQQLLVDAGYLDGGVDGIFGNGSAAAVSAFQKDAGLPENGKADLETQIALYEKAHASEEPMTVKYPVEFDAKNFFGALADAVDADLQPFANASWKCEYDEFEGKGEISMGLTVGTYEYNEVPIDRIRMDASLTVIAENGRVYPAFRVNTKGAYGVYLQALSVKAGSTVMKLEAPAVVRGTEGADIVETAVFEINTDMLAALREANGVLAVRVSGINNTYDLQAAEDLSLLQKYADTVTAAGIAAEAE